MEAGVRLDLTPRQREVLALVADGRTRKEIAKALGLSDHTIRNYVDRIIQRLGARDRVEAVAIALRLGLLD